MPVRGLPWRLESDLALEVEQLDRYRDRVRQSTDLGLVDVAEACARC